MVATRFDRLVRPFGLGSRRASLRLLAGGVLSGVLAWLGAPEAEARKKRKNKNRKKKKKPAQSVPPSPPPPGCGATIGQACTANDQCCTNYCHVDGTCNCVLATYGPPGGCTSDSQCCNGECVRTTGKCACEPVGAPCADHPEVCCGRCFLGVCRACQGPGQPCSSQFDCCTGYCYVVSGCRCGSAGTICSPGPNENCCSGFCDPNTGTCM